MSPINVVPLRRSMSARDPHEQHRVATPLELFFDLVFVVAVASAAEQWHHGLAEGHFGDVRGFLMAFFAIWLAWLNYTWFASAYDCDDVVYRLLTFVIMTGLVLAAGLPELFRSGQSALVVAGYAVMRLAMVAFWLRAARGDPDGRRTALRYAWGIALVQVFWIARLAVSGQDWLYVTFVVGVVLELLVPVVAERERLTPFHPHHIAERYALFTIIVLGEVILAAVQAVQGAMTDGVSGDLLGVIAGGVLIVYSLWWLYFKRDHVELFEGPLRSVVSAGYGHYVVFASVAATGAALAASVDVATHQAHTSSRAVSLALAGSIAVYALALALMHVLVDDRAASATSALATSSGVLVVAALGLPIGVTVLLIGLALAGAVAQHVWSTRDEPVTTTTGS